MDNTFKPALVNLLVEFAKVLTPGVQALFVAFGLLFGLSAGLILGIEFAFQYGLEHLHYSPEGLKNLAEFLAEFSQALELTAQNLQP